MALFIRYVKTKVRLFGLLAVFALLFALVFSLYYLPVEAVGYATLLCGVFGLICLLADFYRVRRNHLILSAIRRQMAAMAGDLPIPSTVEEQEYVHLSRQLYQALISEQERDSQTYRALIDYYTIWAHQIKTPISAIRLLLQGTDHPDKGELSAQLIKIEQYVDMVLQYLKLETRSNDFVIEEHSLDRIVRQSIRKFAPSFIRSGIRLHYDGVDARVLTDEKWLGFSLEQILSNALKYTPKGDIFISMAADRPQTLVIRDTGVGVRPEDLPRVMEQGFTGFNGRTTSQATGIGLYLTRRMLNLLGHTLELQSAPGQGTTVYIGLDALSLQHE